MNEPQVIIVVEDGIVTHIATSLPDLTCRIIDIDAIKAGGHGPADYAPDAVSIDMEEQTATLMKDVE